jgi:hypothetical protein
MMNKLTGVDYLHLVKRFGIIGASQLPIHYLLSVKHPYAPFRLVPNISRRQLHSLHLICGRTIIIFATIHAILYSNVFMQMNMLGKSIQQPKIAVAVISLGVFGAIGVTSIRVFRRKAYIWFYRVHFVGSAMVLPLLFFHALHIRIYILECAVVLALNALLRALSK